MKILLTVVIVLISSCSIKKEMELSISSAKSVLTAPVWIAENKKYFEDEGIKVEIKEFNSGKESFQAMLDRETEISTVAQTPVVFRSFDRNDFYIISSMVTSYNDLKILVIKDLGIRTPEDLKGRKIGLTEGSTGQYFLDLYLAYNGMSIKDVTSVNYKPPLLKDAIASNEVDVIVTWEPHILNTQKMMGDKVHVIPSDGIYREDFYFTAGKKIIDNEPELVERFIRVMKRASEYITNNREESIEIVSNRLGLDKDQAEEVWDSFDYQLILDQSTLSSLEDEARWTIREEFVKGETIPNYLDYIYTDALKEVSPKDVTIVH